METSGLEKAYTGKEKFGLLKDGTIVKIYAVSDPKYVLEKQEIFFAYRFLDRFKFKKKTAWAFHKQFIWFGNKVRTLKKGYKKWMG